ncbi:MAG: D-alanyl-D-alanine carboxypeptidase [Roseibium sp.]|nr:D-alanyl-D-alanine carboxypeptidase [Roseibium sp.]
MVQVRVIGAAVKHLAWLSVAVLAAASPAASETLETRAPIAFLTELETGTVLFAKEPDQPFQPGSLAKVMTAATVFGALDAGDIAPDTLCTVSEHAWRTGGAPARGATMFAELKSDIAVSDLLQGLLVHQANDAAIILAECLDGSEAAFGGRMTALAQDIGMPGSRFVNPTGYEAAGAATTARDLARLAGHILTHHRDRYALFSQAEFTWNGIFQFNRNPLIGEIRHLDGLGAGVSEADGYAALASLNRDNRRIIAVVANLPSDKNRLRALREVIDGAWEYFGVRTLFKKGETVTMGRVFGGTEGSVPLVAAEDVAVLLPRGGTLDYRLRAVYSGPIKAPVEPGRTVGELRIIGENGVVYRAALETGGPAIGGGSLQTRAFDGLKELLFGWF